MAAKKKVALLYGIGEGDYQGRAFVAALQKAGFKVTRDENAADILVTHSAGCWFLPLDYKSKKIVCIGPPYWPGRPLALNTLRKVLIDFWDMARDGAVLAWLNKTAMNLAYIVRYIILKIFTGRYKIRQHRFYRALGLRQMYIIRNRHDAFLTPDAEVVIMKNLGKRVHIHHLPGQHDSCWRDPAPYVQFISSIS